MCIVNEDVSECSTALVQWSALDGCYLISSDEYPTWTRATSISIIFRWKSSGISERKIGTKSARPSLTACRQLEPIKNELLRKIPVGEIKLRQNVSEYGKLITFTVT